VDNDGPMMHRGGATARLCFSSTDLRTWTSHGSPLHARDFAWSSGGAKGSNVVERDGRFYWYVAVNHASIDGGAIGVAVADAPTGPFRDGYIEFYVSPMADGRSMS
jgi:Glycosyl hydrolases family 43